MHLNMNNYCDLYKNVNFNTVIRIPIYSNLFFELPSHVQYSPYKLTKFSTLLACKL